MKKCIEMLVILKQTLCMTKEETQWGRKDEELNEEN